MQTNPLFQILNNPQAQQAIQSIQQQMPNASPREIAFQLAKQKNIDINPLLQRFNLR